MTLPEITLRQLFENGIHFGHRPRYWNPKMAPFIFGIRQKLHIIDLEQTQQHLNTALSAVEKVALSGGKILFVGTKYAAADSIKEQAVRCGMPYINKRWSGGMLTNYKTVQNSVKRLCQLEEKLDSHYLDKISKKEGLSLLREKQKLERSFSGVKGMGGLPDLIFIIDVGVEKIALQEALKLGIPVVGVVDTNNSPDNITYVVPGNDDSIRAIAFYTQVLADVILSAKEKIIVPTKEDNKEKTKAKSQVKRVITTRKKVVAQKAAAPMASPKADEASEIASSPQDSGSSDQGKKPESD